MKKYIALFTFALMLPLSLASAQGMMMWPSATTTDDHTAKEEAEGKELWGELQGGAVKCAALSDGQFGALGEYFMGQMTGDAHVAMNERITQMMGEEGEEAMHVVLGKRLSGCDTGAEFPAGSDNFMMPMMGGWSSPFGSNQTNNSMMNFGFTPFGGFGWIFMILWWALIITGIVALVKWLMSQSRGTHDQEKSPLEILKERYARGEIDKAEFETKKKDLD